MTTRPGYIWSGTEWVSIGQEAVVAPVAYQASAPSTPATGDIWIDSDDDVPSVNSTLYYRWKKTMSGGETSVSGTDDNSLTLTYTAGYESVFINGVLQVRGSDYTATTGTSITDLTALTAGDIVMVESVVAYSVGDTYTQSILDGKFSPITTTGMVLLNTTTVGSAISSVTISNVFSSTYNNYRVVVNAIDASSVTNIRVQFGSTTTGYYGSQLYDSYGGGATGTDRINNGSSILVGVTGTDNDTSSSFDIYSPNLAQRTCLSGTYYSNAYTGWFGGAVFNTTQYTDFNLLIGSGTATSGTIKVYGYK
jgi:hypothetical protein